MSESDGVFLLGVEQFNRGEFFTAHETWETIWLAAAGRDKVFLQGTIQLAAAFHQGKRGNRRGMLALLRRALEKLADFPSSYRGIQLDRLRQEAEGWIKAVASDSPLPCSPLKIECTNPLPSGGVVEEMKK